MKFKHIFFNLVTALLIGSVAYSALGADPIKTAGLVFAAGLVVPAFQKDPQVAAMAVQKEIWTDYIIQKYYKALQFLQYSFKVPSEFIYGGKVVHIPVAGANPNIERNRAVLPATVVKRTDSEITYSIAEFTSDPVLIPNADLYELSYDKMDSVIGDHMNALMELAAEWMIYDWLTASGGAVTNAQQLRTLGAATAAHLAGATGNRKAFTKESLKAARTLMNKNNIPSEGRYALLDSDMMDQLMDDPDLKARDKSLELDMKGGIVARLYGFDLLERSTAGVFDNTATPVAKDPDAAAGVADNAAAICWQRDQVENALGQVELFEDQGNPTFYGDIYSAILRSSGRLRRDKGVVAIIQEAAA